MRLNKLNELLKALSSDNVKYRIGSNNEGEKRIIADMQGTSDTYGLMGIGDNPDIKIIVNNGFWTLTEEGVVEIEEDEQ